jgi:hypothetical protein
MWLEPPPRSGEEIPGAKGEADVNEQQIHGFLDSVKSKVVTGVVGGVISC